MTEKSTQIKRYITVHPHLYIDKKTETRKQNCTKKDLVIIIWPNILVQKQVK
jgi:hypothetical protein